MSGVAGGVPEWRMTSPPPPPPLRRCIFGLGISAGGDRTMLRNGEGDGDDGDADDGEGT